MLKFLCLIFTALAVAVVAGSRVLVFMTCCPLLAACPVLCSGNGQYTRGRCQCYSGWKGTECDVPTSQCIDPQCSGHGLCVAGNCVCNTGHKGPHCEQGRCWGRGGGNKKVLPVRLKAAAAAAARCSIFSVWSSMGIDTVHWWNNWCFQLGWADNAVDVVIDTVCIN